MSLMYNKNNNGPSTLPCGTHKEHYQYLSLHQKYEHIVFYTTNNPGTSHTQCLLFHNSTVCLIRHDGPQYQMPFVGPSRVPIQDPVI